MKKCSWIYNMGRLTEYINRELRDNSMIKDWWFEMDDMYNHALVVRIDYHNDFHSRDMFDLIWNGDIEVLKMQFDHALQAHAREYCDFMLCGARKV